MKPHRPALRALLLLLLLGGATPLHAERPEDLIAPMTAAPRAGATPAPYGDTVALDSLTVRLRYAQVKSALLFETASSLHVEAGDQVARVEAGRYKLEVENATPARQRWHVFPKTFQPTEVPEMNAYMKTWRDKGYKPEPMVFGKRLRSGGDRIIDNRVYYVSLARFDKESEANALKKKLEGESVWAWVRPETMAPGTARCTLRDAAGKVRLRGSAPVQLQGEAALYFSDIDNGFWQKRPKTQAFAAPVTVEIGPGGVLDVFGILPLETYLRGVLPAEMPSSWPVEALKAQAVAARSEVLASLAGKHSTEGFDFCAQEHCRAYSGVSGHKESTDAAVAGTRGDVLVSNGKIVATVFSADCGGWTENNDTVWSGPADASLRAVRDAAGSKAKAIDPKAVRAFLTQKQDAYCAGDKDNFRWTKVLAEAELAQSLNKQYNIGRIVSIELGDRGPGGRLQWVRIKGTSKTEVIRKELNIRRAFGGLPSALCIMDTERAPDGSRKFIFRGGGRGHGVGLCQHGTRGMVAKGSSYRDVLAHYFTGTTLERLE